MDTPATGVIYATALLRQEGLGGSFSQEKTVVLNAYTIATLWSLYMFICNICLHPYENTC